LNGFSQWEIVADKDADTDIKNAILGTTISLKKKRSFQTHKEKDHFNLALLSYKKILCLGVNALKLFLSCFL